jgi:CDP-diacylglycerol---serine O-phosphatidyltransferase
MPSLQNASLAEGGAAAEVRISTCGTFFRVVATRWSGTALASIRRRTGNEGRHMSQSDRHFSMIRDLHLADLLTLANGFCGVAAIFAAMKFLVVDAPRLLILAGCLVAAAFVFDVLDGKVARWRHSASAMGRELDSLADVISFGVAPAAIAFAAGMNQPLDQVILIFFALCGLSRLARFNITADAIAARTGRVEYFEGTPIPTSVVPLGLTLAAFLNGDLYPVAPFGVAFHLPVVLFFASGCLMVSKTLRIPKP